jgi:hypothetical protein
MRAQDAKNGGGLAGFVEDLSGAVRENPIAAGLVGMGVCWMLFGGSRLSGLGSALPDATRNLPGKIGGAASAVAGVVGHSLGDTAARIADGSRRVTGAISSEVAKTAAGVRDQAEAAYEAVKSHGEAAITSTVPTDSARPGQFTRSAGSVVQDNLTKTFEAQPLLLGVIGIAIGAGIGSALPSTAIEQDVMGEAAAVAREKIEGLASETSERVVAEVKHEAEVQGFTAASAKQSAEGLTQKLKSVGAEVTAHSPLSR